ncbi:MAG TPA: hypothetical protein ENJ88_11130 [Phaeodactylibacter sp.]|nr:hypothetical protein [Phaeodactylibacter sp.]
MLTNRSLLWTFIGLMVTLQACQPDKGKHIPDVSDIPMEVHIRRFDRDLFNIDTNDIENGLKRLQQSYPKFSELFFNQILGATDPRYAPEGPIPFIKGFITHESLRKLYDTVQIVFPDMQPYERDFEQAFRFFKYYFPEKTTPTVTAFISEYSIANFIYGDNDLAVGLDFFLGRDYPYLAYNAGNPNFSNYLTRTNTPEYLVSKTLKPLVEDLVPPPSDNRLLDLMLRNGKKLYILQQLLPYAPDSIITEFTQAQLNWAEDNELNIWTELVTADLLYSSNWSDIRKLVDYSPNVPGMPPEAPGRIANWIGLKIVESYLKRHPETSLQELIDLQDSDAFLQASKYKPKRK